MKPCGRISNIVNKHLKINIKILIRKMEGVKLERP